ncbi:MAG: hypothetical protein K0R26_1862 [Bacteroidota bacterium]|jgi:hypothetical protein|nr:hypothetical protein [Bacteroidota bacterium]
MNRLNRFFVLFCCSAYLTSHSQTAEVHAEKTNNSVLLSFDAILTEKKVELTWSSDTENNNNFFIVEKSKDAVYFETVTSLKGFGNYSSLMSYFDVDYTPYDGISFYRLKQTDMQGNVLSSRLISVNNKFGNASYAGNTIMESPSDLLGAENSEVLLVLRNEKGDESFSKGKVDQNHNLIVSENEVKPENGTYTVIASSNNKLYSHKVYVK